MLSRLVVGAVAILALVAFADAVRQHGATAPMEATERRPSVRWLVERAPDLRGRRAAPSLQEIKAAFPGPAGGRYDVSHVAAAGDGLLVVAVYRIDGLEPIRAALQLWLAGSLLHAFLVEPGSFAGGLGFGPGGNVIATFTLDGRPALYDRRGRHVPANALRTF
jgi:hypothetical protein